MNMPGYSCLPYICTYYFQSSYCFCVHLGDNLIAFPLGSYLANLRVLRENTDVLGQLEVPCVAGRFSGAGEYSQMHQAAALRALPKQARVRCQLFPAILEIFRGEKPASLSPSKALVCGLRYLIPPTVIYCRAWYSSKMHFPKMMCPDFIVMLTSCIYGEVDVL